MSNVAYFATPKKEDLLGEAIMRAAAELKNALGRTYSQTYHNDAEASIEKLDELLDQAAEMICGN